MQVNLELNLASGEMKSPPGYHSSARLGFEHFAPTT